MPDCSKGIVPLFSGSSFTPCTSGLGQSRVLVGWKSDQEQPCGEGLGSVGGSEAGVPWPCVLTAQKSNHVLACIQSMVGSRFFSSAPLRWGPTWGSAHSSGAFSVRSNEFKVKKGKFRLDIEEIEILPCEDGEALVQLPEKLQMSHPCRCPGWMDLWATWTNERSPCPWQGAGTRSSLRSGQAG